MKAHAIAIHIFMILIVTVIFVLLYNWTNNASWESWSQWLAIFGTVASIYGIALALYQIYHLSSTTKAIQDELNKKSEKTHSFLSYGDLEKQEQNLIAMSSYLKDKQYAMVEYQLQEAKKILLEISNNISIKDVIEGSIDRLIQNIGIDITNLNEARTSGISINQKVLLEHNNSIITLLQKASTILKHKEI